MLTLASVENMIQFENMIVPISRLSWGPGERDWGKKKFLRVYGQRHFCVAYFV